MTKKRKHYFERTTETEKAQEESVRQPDAKYLFIAFLTAFVGGFCVMAIEIIAGRLIARYLGVSLYTWTSVIGVVLAGIAIGNYIGGRIADRYSAKKTLSTLFILASISCVMVPALNQLMGNWPILLHLSWPVRITLHVAVIFFLPSGILGMISPVVAKFALDQGFQTGRTIGDVYAWGAAGSIFGTFVTGFFLITHMGTIAVVWSIAGVLGIIGIIYGGKTLFPRACVASLILLLLFAFASLSPFQWTKTVASHLFMVDMQDENIVYEKDSLYSHISVLKTEKPGVYDFKIDGLTHSRMNLDEPTDIEHIYEYRKALVEITNNVSVGKEQLSVLIMGGGGYVLPHYIEKFFPGSPMDVVEIDPEVTKAAKEAFGLPEMENLSIHHMDARNYIDELAKDEKFHSYDFIYNDALINLAVPYHLTTHEFNEKISRLLAPDGLYAINLVDNYKSQTFLKAMVHTMRQTFPYVYIVRPEVIHSGFETFLIIASLKEVDKNAFASSQFSGTLLRDDELKINKDDPQVIVLTDNFAPVDNMLKEVFAEQGEERVGRKIMERGKKLVAEYKFEEAINQYNKLLRINPEFAAMHNNIGSLKAWQGDYKEAIKHYYKALSIEPEYKPAVIGLASAFDKRGMRKAAIDYYYKALEIDPLLTDVYVSLGNALYLEQKVDDAILNFQKALEIDPEYDLAKNNLNSALIEKSRMESKKELNNLEKGL